jgi:hypothetical protein
MNVSNDRKNATTGRKPTAGGVCVLRSAELPVDREANVAQAELRGPLGPARELLDQPICVAGEGVHLTSPSTDSILTAPDALVIKNSF